MSAAEALRAARALGYELTVDGNDLWLDAASRPSADTLETLTRHKAEIVRLLRPSKAVWSAEDWRLFFEERAGISEFDGGQPRAEAKAQAFDRCIVEWLNRNPAPSTPGRCAWCGRADAGVVPYGIEPGTHTWLHTECWPAWHAKRRTEAAASLNAIGIPGSIDAHDSSTRG